MTSDISWSDIPGMALLRKFKRYLQVVRLAHDEWHLFIQHTGDDTFEKFKSNFQVVRLAHDEWHLVIWHTGDDTFEKFKSYLQVVRLAHDEWHLVIRHTGDDTFEKIKCICKLFVCRTCHFSSLGPNWRDTVKHDFGWKMQSCMNDVVYMMCMHERMNVQLVRLYDCI